MDFLKDFRDKRAGRHEAPATLPVPEVSGAPGDTPSLPSVPRNRAECRFWDHRVRKLAGKLRMRDEGKRAHNRTMPRWQRRLLRDLDGHWADKHGRAAR